MLQNLFWIILRSVAIPIAAVYLLSETALGEEGALIAVGLALLVVNVASIGMNGLKMLVNTLLFRPGAAFKNVITIIIQIASVIGIWGYYLSEYTDLLKV